MDMRTCETISDVRMRIEAMIAHPATTYRMARILRELMNADPVDAVNEAKWVAQLMKDRAEAVARA